MSNVVTIENLTPGMVIIQITKQNGPVKIRKSGLVTSDAMVQGLAEMGVQELEIDPDQTVEIAPVTQHRTQTQALLRGEHDTKANFDSSLSEQFNRSLFLPTVQGLPSMWSVYAKELAAFGVTLLLGVGIGFMAATPSLWWPLISHEDTQITPVAITPPADISSFPFTDDTPTPLGANAEVAVNVASAEDANTEGKQAPQVANDNQSGGLNDKQTPPSAAQNKDDEVQESAVASLSEEGGEVLNDSGSDSDIAVSPELLARFNAAVEALDKQTDEGRSEPARPLTVHDDIQRVDQLPVRLLTRLPSMNFSAHMYASQVDDRWVRVNGVQRFEGDWIDDKVQIINIEAQRVILSFEGELFSMSALTDW